ncbi:hypothetical protein [Deinococcus pimensis]|uniref:hypothetical protein n=1 Tax=Deinococcus pimensis TaxID=309888 RepID=UPI000480049C|nr:hypothetical protein [Deinococcus pimensis]
MIISPQDISDHSARTGTSVFTVVPGVDVRRDDLIHWEGRAYAVQRVQRTLASGAKVVETTYRAKL